ncbi:MAG: metal-dependent hydrolase [Acidobacteria bacterium]|nr:metal-dependent hydrolase [Acidobacteriota bacterium]
MDNLCHTLTGAALGKAGLASRTRYGMATLMVAANLPDVDVAVFLTDTLPVSFRRGWTHGIVAQVVLPIALAGIVWAIGRNRPAPDRTRPHPPAPARTCPHPSAPDRTRFGPLLLLSYIGLYSHIFLDYLNSYGLRLLMPFSGRWFYGDALFIVDPWMWGVLGAGVLLTSIAARRGAAEPGRPARVALAVATAYTLAMLASNLWARTVVHDGLTRAGRPADTRFMVTPVFANPFRREVLVDTGDRYEKGFVWFEPGPHFRPAGYGVDKGFGQPEARAAIATPRSRAYLTWSRFPFVVVDRTEAPPQLWLNDYRYSDASGRVGWAGLSVRIED